MFLKEIEQEMDTTKEKMWSIWTDINNWNQWIDSVESSTLEGNFEEGVKGSMKMINGPTSSFTIVDVVENESFICRSKVLFCTMDAGHFMKEENGKLKVKLYAKASGPLLFILKRSLEKESKGMETVFEKLTKLTKE